MDQKDVLEKLCRVCGRQVVTKAMKVKHTCADQEQLMAVFQVSTVPDTHPRLFCHSCKIFF